MTRVSFKRAMSLFVAAFFVLSLFTVINIPTASACSCIIPGTPNEEFERFSTVFSGVATDIDWMVGGYKVTFDVDKIWKGLPTTNASKVMVSTGRGDGDCGYGFQKGESYLIYASGEDELNVSICSRTKPLVLAAEDLAALGEGQYPVANSAPLGEFGRMAVNPVVIGIVVVVVLAVIIYTIALSRKKVI